MTVFKCGGLGSGFSTSVNFHLALIRREECLTLSEKLTNWEPSKNQDLFVCFIAMMQCFAGGVSDVFLCIVSWELNASGHILDTIPGAVIWRVC